MANLIEQAIACDDGDRAAKIIQEALGIESDDVANYVFPKTWPADENDVPASSANGCRLKRGSSPHDAPNAGLSVRIAFGHPWRFGNLTRRLVVDRPYVTPGSRRFPPPCTTDQTAWPVQRSSSASSPCCSSSPSQHC
jgi:hypothetical protein